MAEVNAIERWLYTVLSSDGALTAVVSTRIYADRIPQDVASPYPCVVFGHLSARDLMGVGAFRIWANSLYVIRAIDETESFAGNVKTAADRIDAVLHAASGSNVDGEIFACTRESPFRMSEETDGRVFQHLGGQYRILAI